MILHFAENERTILVQALTILAEEYSTIADAAISPTLARGFRRDAENAQDLANKVSSIKEQVSEFDLRLEVIRLLNAGLKIHAIKYVREQRPLGLKEAKDYVDGIQATIEREKMERDY